MTTVRALTAELTIVGAEITFSFPNDVTDNDYKKIVKKVERHCDTSYYPAVPVYFVERKTIRVIISYDATNARYKMYDELNPRLQRLIDSYDGIATYGWSR